MHTKLITCPACGSRLQLKPTHGHWDAYFCQRHKQFDISVEALRAMEGNPLLLQALAKKLQEKRSGKNESLLIYKSDLTSDDEHLPDV